MANFRFPDGSWPRPIKEVAASICCICGTTSANQVQYLYHASGHYRGGLDENTNHPLRCRMIPCAFLATSARELANHGRGHEEFNILNNDGSVDRLFALLRKAQPPPQPPTPPPPPPRLPRSLPSTPASPTSEGHPKGPPEGHPKGPLEGPPEGPPLSLPKGSPRSSAKSLLNGSPDGSADGSPIGPPASGQSVSSTEDLPAVKRLRHTSPEIPAPVVGAAQSPFRPIMAPSQVTNHLPLKKRFRVGSCQRASSIRATIVELATVASESGGATKPVTSSTTKLEIQHQQPATNVAWWWKLRSN